MSEAVRLRPVPDFLSRGTEARAMFRACQQWLALRRTLLACGVAPTSLEDIDIAFGAALRAENRRDDAGAANN